MMPATRPAGVQRSRRRSGIGQGDRHVLVTQVAVALGAILTLAGLLQLVLHEFADLIPLVVLSPLGALALWWLVGRLAEPDDRRLVLRIALAGALLRVGLALVIHYTLPVWFFAPDQLTYQEVGWQTLQYHQGRGGMPWQIQDTLELGYFYWNAFLYLIFGYAPLAPKLVNAFVGTASALFAYRMAGELAGRGPAMLAVLLTMFFPSLVLWSTLNLRDPIVLLVTLALFLSVVRLRTRPSGRAFFAAILSLTLLVLFRDYVAAMALFGLVGATFIGKARGLPVNLLVGAVLFGLAILAYQQFGLGAQWVESASFEAISQQRSALATGGTAFRPGVDISTPLRGLQYLPLGMAFFLFSPFPWQIGSALSLMTLPEQLVWYALLPMVVSGGLYLVRERYHAFGPLLVFLALTTSIYALVEGNAGTAYRHRAQVLVFFLILASVGMTLRAARKKAATARAPGA
ncbi:MAG: glycosyltransferase family protein [Longimicrobiales bacterium]